MSNSRAATSPAAGTQRQPSADSLTKFRVTGLHGAVTMDLDIEANKLVLVGENGAGKSTFANLIYYFLTRQWLRLQTYRFKSIDAVLGGEELNITPDHLAKYFAARQEFTSHRVPPRVTDAFYRLIEDLGPKAIEDNPASILRLAEELRIPARLAHDLLIEHLREGKDKKTHIGQVDHQIADHVKGQCLYLPTYRRIEQDLRSIFPSVEIETALRTFRERLSRRKAAPYVELVEFGMEDVEQTITTRMTQIKESVRTGLDNLTGTYLRDVLRGDHYKVDVDGLASIDQATLDAIFMRIDEVTLPAVDKARLKEKVHRVTATQAVEEQDKVIAHFLSKLIALYSEQQANERDVRDFVRICNGYLTGKQLVYDNTKYTIFIDADAKQAKPGEKLELKMLSSGEKQIVSLFSHLYLSTERQFFVVIDEPELSLSVPWQRRLLPDILETGMCRGLIAATHSPFVWDNELEPYVRSLPESTFAYTGD